MKTTDWMDRMACKDMDPSHFDEQPVRGRGCGSSEAEAACRACPVVDQCLQLTLTSTYGYSGGKTSAQRRQLVMA